MAISTLYWSYQMFREKIENDLDLQIDNSDESFITDTEFLGYVNDAIDRCEQLVHTLYEDYFLTRGALSLVSGTEEYALPDGIYAHKLRRLIYRNGSEIYRVERIRDWKKFENYELNRLVDNSRLYEFFLLNSVAGAPTILITPIPSETRVDAIQLWYIRQANRLVLDADICDIPESNNYILAYLRVKCFEKEHNPMLQKATVDLAEEKSLLESTLAGMVVDADNEIEMDTTLYEDLS